MYYGAVDTYPTRVLDKIDTGVPPNDNRYRDAL